MKKIIFTIACILFVSGMCVAAPRFSVFSTTVDWSAVTGLSLYQYTGNFSGKNDELVGRGLVLYYLDSFPCYGQADSVRVWIGKRGEVVGNLRLVCVTNPTEVKFAWRNAERDAVQDTSTGILTCPVVSIDREFNINLADCVRGPDWQEYK